MTTPAQFATYPSLRDRVVLVTGGASGIGESIVEAFAQQHARVAFLDVAQDAGIALVERLVVAGLPQPLFLACDLTDIDALKAAVATVEQRLGAMDVLVNNAANDVRHTIEEVTPESFDRSIDVNLRHQFFAAQAVLPAMKAAGRGSIINMSSISWMIPSVGLPVYITAKAAVVGMTRTLAHELGQHNIRVNAVLPGAILTEKQQRLWLNEEYKREVLSRQALKRHLYPDEVAGALLVHPSDPDVLAHEPAYMKSALASSPPIVQKVGCKVLLPVMLHTGLLRLMGNPGSGWPYGIANLNPDQQRELKFLSTNPETAQTEGEGCVQDESMSEVRAAPTGLLPKPGPSKPGNNKIRPKPIYRSTTHNNGKIGKFQLSITGLIAIRLF